MKISYGSIVQMFIYAIILISSGLGYVLIARKLFSESDTISYARSMLVGKNGKVKRALFSPDDDIKRVLIGLISAEKEKIIVSIYTFTDTDIAKALENAIVKRNILVEIVTDRSCSLNQWSKIKKLAQCTSVHFYPVDCGTSLMHNKFIVFFKNITEEPILWTGSYNFTRSASYFNQENVIVITDEELIKSYIAHFKKLKGRSMRVGQEKLYDTCCSVDQEDIAIQMA